MLGYNLPTHVTKIANEIFGQIVPSGFEFMRETPESGSVGQARVY